MSGLVECHELWPKISKTTGIVSRIAEYTNSTVGIGLQCLPTAAQMGECYYVAEALLEGFWWDVEAYLAQLMNSCDDGVGIAWLAITAQRTLEGAIIGCLKKAGVFSEKTSNLSIAAFILQGQHDTNLTDKEIMKKNKTLSSYIGNYAKPEFSKLRYWVLEWVAKKQAEE